MLDADSYCRTLRSSSVSSKTGEKLVQGANKNYWKNAFHLFEVLSIGEAWLLLVV